MRSLNSTNKLLSFANGWGTHHHGGHTCLEPFSAYCHPHSHPTLQGNNAPPAPPDCEPQSLLTIPGSPNPWLASHLPTTLRSGTVTQWLNKLKLPQAQLNTIQSNWAKAESCGRLNQPAQLTQSSASPSCPGSPSPSFRRILMPTNSFGY